MRPIIVALAAVTVLVACGGGDPDPQQRCDQEREERREAERNGDDYNPFHEAYWCDRAAND